MSDWIGLGIIILVVVGALFGLSRLAKPYNVTPEEFDKRVHESPSWLSAGLSGLQKMLDPATGKAAEVQEDFKQGYYNAGQESGDKPDTSKPDEESNDENTRTRRT
ncbi:MAG TPA: hypothetical protein VJM12_16555 [Pyrinomonadaceae bacterium]|nr:hypothetical protein [Pyrinomonadaceae bacterium]